MIRKINVVNFYLYFFEKIYIKFPKDRIPIMLYELVGECLCFKSISPNKTFITKE